MDAENNQVSRDSKEKIGFWKIIAAQVTDQRILLCIVAFFVIESIFSIAAFQAEDPTFLVIALCFLIVFILLMAFFWSNQGRRRSYYEKEIDSLKQIIKDQQKVIEGQQKVIEQISAAQPSKKSVSEDLSRNTCMD